MSTVYQRGLHAILCRFEAVFSACCNQLTEHFPQNIPARGMLLGNLSRINDRIVVCGSRIKKISFVTKYGPVAGIHSFRLYFIDCPRPLSIIGPVIAVYMACREGIHARVSQYQAWPCPVCWRLCSASINGGMCPARPGAADVPAAVRPGAA